MITKLSSALLSEIRGQAAELGFDQFGAVPAVIPEPDQSAYKKWIASGRGATMKYMTERPEIRLKTDRVFPNAKTIFSLGVSYYQGPLPPKPGPTFGRVARYAWGLDYHDVIAERLIQFVSWLNKRIPDPSAVVATDSKPLLERALARTAGIGFVGKNTVLIVPQSPGGNGTKFHIGSYVFLAEVLVASPLSEELTSPNPIANKCGQCTACISDCPTGALEEPYGLNANKCIAYLTIENKLGIDAAYRSAIGDWIFGCDVCQDVCPFNARAFETRWPEFSADRGVGPWVDVREILQLTGKAPFIERWGQTPFSRAKWTGLVRNALVVAGNSGEKELMKNILPWMEQENSILRSHAVWALSKLADDAEFNHQRKKWIPIETDPMVLNEWGALSA